MPLPWKSPVGMFHRTQLQLPHLPASPCSTTTHRQHPWRNRQHRSSSLIVKAENANNLTRPKQLATSCFHPHPTSTPSPRSRSLQPSLREDPVLRLENRA